MWIEHFWMGGMWIFPLLMIIIMLIIIFKLFGRDNFRPPWYQNNTNYSAGQKETALEILKKRYANGEINKDEFEKIKKDIL